MARKLKSISIRVRLAIPRRRFITYVSKNLSQIALSVLLVICGAALLTEISAVENARQAAKQLQDELASTQRSTDCSSRDTWTANTSREFQIQSNNVSRMYRVHLPKNFKSNQTYPLILGFAGKGGWAAQIESYSRLDILPVIAVYPQALRGTDGAYAWQGAPYSPLVDDIAFVRGILDRVEGQFCIQKANIFAAGLSNGGGMSWLLSCMLPDRIAAFAMFAGAFYYPEQSCNPSRPAAILNVHGDLDTTVPYGGSIERKLPDIDDWVAQRAKRNGCKTQPSIIHTDATTTVTTWSGCKDNATVQNIRLHGGGHVWPVHLDTDGQIANDDSAKELLEFFLEHPLY